MRVCMISAHTPPEQSANALLPVMLGGELTRHGVDVSYVVHPTRDHPHTPPADGVVLTPRRGRGRFGRTIGGAVLAGSRMALGARGPIKRSDVVHLHSNGFIVEVGAFLAQRFRKPSSRSTARTSGTTIRSATAGSGAPYETRPVASSTVKACSTSRRRSASRRIRRS